MSLYFFLYDFLISVHDSGEYNSDNIDSIDYKELHDFPDDLWVFDLIEEEGLVVVDEQFDEVHFQLFELEVELGYLGAHEFCEEVDLLVEFGGAGEVHVAELFGEEQVFEVGL